MRYDPFRVDGKVFSELQAVTPPVSKIAGFVISEGSPTVDSFRIMFDPNGIRTAVPLDPGGVTACWIHQDDVRP